jgi:hypothetical protein
MVMTTPMSSQVLAERRLSERLQSPWENAVILERLARGGGAVRWYLATTPDDLGVVVERLRGGSCVSFYFDDQLQVERDIESVRQRMFDAVTAGREILLAYPEQQKVDLSVELATGSNELAELLVQRSEGSLVVWGPWPSRDGNPNGTITIDLVDEDGVLRNHPH